MNRHVLAFEIGTEEIPAFDLVGAEKQLAQMVPARLEAARIPFESVEIHTTPRRLIVIVRDIADETPAVNEEFKGPRASIAFDADGNPTKAAAGFARGKGIPVEALERRVVDGDEYIFARREIPAAKVKGLLPEILAGLIPDLKWPRSMHWGNYDETFSRPVRYLLALLDDEVVPVHWSQLDADRLTAGHRVLSRGMHEVATADALLDVLRENRVIPNMAEREAAIRAGVEAIEKETGCRAELPEKTLTEVINLSEYPQALCARFDEEFLQVPEEIIVDAMLMHQRYFPLYDEAGKLTNNFIIVSNGDPAYAGNIIAGNERVVRARLDDAKFFYEEDLKRPLESYVEKLDQVVFQEKLGTVRDKAKRLVVLADALAADAGLNETDANDLRRAALLCKADLVTNAVIEFTSVQGVMGSYYATASGETEQVARAIGEHYQPRFAGDALPQGVVGQLTAFADKLDTICGLFAADQAPTGSKDPFALRRQAIGIVNMLMAGLPVSLEKAIDASLATFEGIEFDREKTRAEVIDFFVTRTRVICKEEGIAPDVIEAVLAAGVVEPAVIDQRTHALTAIREESPEEMDDLATAYARANNLRDPEVGTELDENALAGASLALYQAVQSARTDVNAALEATDYASALKALAALRAPIDAFFDEVKVMADDEEERANNLRLLNAFVELFSHVADFGKMARK